jgi:hypothetical protein
MAIGFASPASLALANNLIWPSSGTIGHLILLSGALYTGTFTVNASTDVITTASAHNLVTGARVRLTTAGALPALSAGSLSTSTDYFAIVTGSTTLQLATTQAFAISGTPVLNFTDTGSGTHTITEQRPTTSDPLAVLIGKELSHASYTRRAISGATAQVVAGIGQQAATAVSYTPSGTDMIYRQSLFLMGGNSTIGNTTGTLSFLATESTDITISVGSTKVILVTPRIQAS